MLTVARRQRMADNTPGREGMHKPDYNIKIGSETFASRSYSILDIRVDLDIDIPLDSSRLILRSSDKTEAIRVGDPLEIEMGYEASLTSVFAGKVDSLKVGPSGTVIWGISNLSSMTATRINRVYEGQTAGDIAMDLARAAGMGIEVAEDGLNLLFYTVDDSKDTYTHLKDLARRCGFDLFQGRAGKLVFKGYASQSPKTFAYGRDILDIEVCCRDGPTISIKVLGESPSDSQGNDTSHWISKKVVEGSAGTGEEILSFEDPVVKDKESADKVAKAFMEAMFIASKGSAKVLGTSEVRPGDTIELKGMPLERMNGTFKATSVSHILNRSEGFVSFLSWKEEAGALAKKEAK
jgi:phage protein D